MGQKEERRKRGQEGEKERGVEGRGRGGRQGERGEKGNDCSFGESLLRRRMWHHLYHLLACVGTETWDGMRRAPSRGQKTQEGTCSEIFPPEMQAKQELDLIK